MTLLHNMEMLSLWEIAHRMHGIAPDEHEDPPSGVGDTLRELLVGTRDVFNPYDSGGNPIGYGLASVVFGRPSKFERQIEKAINERTYDNRWLNSVVVEQGEFELWCALHNRPLPEFWFPSHWKLSPKAQFYRDNWAGRSVGGGKSEKGSPPFLRPVQVDRKLCQEAAKRLWGEFPSLTIHKSGTDHHFLQPQSAQLEFSAKVRVLSPVCRVHPTTPALRATPPR